MNKIENQLFPPNFVDIADDISRPILGTPLGDNISSLDHKKTVVIIGAGYVGISAALHLAESGKFRVIVLEADKVGGGASGKSAGHISLLQSPDNKTIKHCGHELGERLIQHAKDGTNLVRDLIEKHNIPCNLRDGYMIVEDSEQVMYDASPYNSDPKSGGEFGIDPYPYVLGLAMSAKKAGAIFHENTPVQDIKKMPDGYAVITDRGHAISADFVLASGNHRMMTTIPALSSLRSKTTELRITTLVTPPLPNDVLRAIMPQNADKKYPFANNAVNVVYGSILPDNRLVFGAFATALKDPDPKAIHRAMINMFPTLEKVYKESTGKDLTTKVFVRAEKLNFTRSYLPLVGMMDDHLLYVAGLGGHGIAAGTLLGKAAAEKISTMTGHFSISASKVFDDFAAINHGWLPASEPLRAVVAASALQARDIAKRLQAMLE